MLYQKCPCQKVPHFCYIPISTDMKPQIQGVFKGLPSLKRIWYFNQIWTWALMFQKLMLFKDGWTGISSDYMRDSTSLMAAYLFLPQGDFDAAFPSCMKAAVQNSRHLLLNYEGLSYSPVQTAPH